MLAHMFRWPHRSQVLQWNGVSWSVFAAPTTRNLFAVDGSVMVGEFGTVLSHHWSGKLVLDTPSVNGPRPAGMYTERNPSWHVNDTDPLPIRLDETRYIDAAADTRLVPQHLYAVSNRGEQLFFSNEIKNGGAGGGTPSELGVNGNGGALLISPDNWHIGSLQFYSGSAYVLRTRCVWFDCDDGLL